MDTPASGATTYLRCPMCAVMSAVTVRSCAGTADCRCPRDGCDWSSLAGDLMTRLPSFLRRRPGQDPSVTPLTLSCRGVDAATSEPACVYWDESRFASADGGDYLLWGRSEQGVVSTVPVIGRRTWGAAPPRTGAGREYNFHNTPRGISVNYPFSIPSNETTPLKKVLKWITVHHTGHPARNEPATARAIQKMHFADIGGMGPGADIGYHYIIDGNGAIYEGRPLGIKGSHTGMFNGGNVGIALAGDFERLSGDVPAEAAVASLTRLTQTLASRFGIRSVWWHSERNRQAELGPTNCPGARLIPRINHLRARYPGPPA